MDTIATNAAAQSESADATEPSGPIARIVGGSILTGLVGALLLTFVVFAGAQEHVITGSAMLAFGAGWAMLAILSTRLTSQPQRWAFVPAAYMGAVGAGLLLAAPSNHTLNAVGWVWPPIVLALAIWMTVTARRQLQSRTRPWLLYPIFVALAAASIGGSLQTVHGAFSNATNAMPGQAYDVNGHLMHLKCTGTGGPTVVLLGGSGEDSTNWAWITADVDNSTRVCAYDRAGQAWSADASQLPDGVQIASDLHTLLDIAHVPGPYVLAGHSVGGPYAMVFASRYPSEVAGLVLLDSATPRQLTALPDYAAFYSIWHRTSALLPSLARMGVGQIAFHSNGNTLPAAAAAAEHEFAVDTRALRNQRDEFEALPATFHQAQGLTTLGSKPLAVITAGKNDGAGWPEEQDVMATLSSNTVHRTVDATHESLLLDKTNSAFSSQAILAVVLAARTSSPITLS